MLFEFIVFIINVVFPCFQEFINLRTIVQYNVTLQHNYGRAMTNKEKYVHKEDNANSKIDPFFDKVLLIQHCYYLLLFTTYLLRMSSLRLTKII